MSYKDINEEELQNGELVYVPIMRHYACASISIGVFINGIVYGINNNRLSIVMPYISDNEASVLKVKNMNCKMAKDIDSKEVYKNILDSNLVGIDKNALLFTKHELEKEI